MSSLSHSPTQSPKKHSRFLKNPGLQGKRLEYKTKEEYTYNDLPLGKLQERKWKAPLIKLGYAHKRTKKITASWNKRLFVLNKAGLWYFTNEKKGKVGAGAPITIKDMKFWDYHDKKKFHCVEIARKKKNFQFSFETETDKNEWIEALKTAGGEYELHTIPGIADKDPKKWTIEEVQDWLTKIPLPTKMSSNYKERYGNEFVDKNVNGKKLLTYQSVHLRREIGIGSHQERSFLLNFIEDMRTRKRFNQEELVVLKKIIDMVQARKGGPSPSMKHQVRLARALSDPQKLCGTYLSLDSLTEKSLFMKQLDDIHSSNDEEEEDGEEMDLLGDQAMCDQPLFSNVEKKKMPVKLVITEIARTRKDQVTRSLLSPFMSRIPSLHQEFGLFHTALIVGPWYLEWTKTNLVIPRRLMSTGALISADVDEVEESKSLEKIEPKEITERIAKVVCKWNNRKFYDNVKNNEGQGNCQDFVEEVMDALGLKVPRDGAFGHYLNGMKRRGKSKMEFKPSKKFIKYFGLDLKEESKGEKVNTPSKTKDFRFHFRKHKELDQFVRDIQKKAQEKRTLDELREAISGDFKDEYRLLKSFDRAFWLRHLKNMSDPDCQPLYPVWNGKKKRHVRTTSRYTTLCPFADPRETMSFM